MIKKSRDFINRFIKHPLFSGSLIMVGGNMIANAVNYLYHLIMGRVLGPANYGVLASLYSIIYLIGIIPTSTSISIVKFVSSADEKEVYSIYSAIKRFVFILSIVISISFLLLSPFISNFLKIQGVSTVILIAPIIFFSLVTLVNQASSQGLLKFYGSVVPTLISSFVKFALGVTLVLIGWSVFGAVFAIGIGLCLAYFYSSWFIKRVLKKAKLEKYDLKPFFKYALPVLLQALAFTSIFSTDVLLVKHFFDPFHAGIYGALSTLGKIIFFATSPITATMFPIVSRRKAVGESYTKVFFLAIALVLVASGGITLFYWLFPHLAIGALYGKAYLSASNELVWMGIFISFYSLTSLLVNYSLSLGSYKIILFPLLGAIAQIPLIWIWHSSLLEVIQVSLGVTSVMFLSSCLYVGYNRLHEKYGQQ